MARSAASWFVTASGAGERAVGLFDTTVRGLAQASSDSPDKGQPTSQSHRAAAQKDDTQPVSAHGKAYVKSLGCLVDIIYIIGA